MESEYTFYFCSDGVLRLKYFSSHTLLDASFIRQRYKSDFSFFMAWWDKEAKLEKGLTVGKFLSCIEPFSDFWSEYTQCRLSEFIEESKKPVLVEDGRTHEFDYLEISWEHYIGSSLEYEKINKSDFQSIEAYFNQKRRVRVLDTVEHRRGLKLTGYYEGENEHYCANGIEMNRLAHTPLCLRPYEDIVVDDYFTRKYLTQIEPHTGQAPNRLLNTQHMSVFSHKKNQYEQYWLKTKAFYSLKDVIGGFFDDMEQSIEQRNHNIASIKKAIDEINLDEKSAISSKTFTTQDATPVSVEDKILPSNIVSLQDMKKMKAQQPSYTTTEEPVLSVLSNQPSNIHSLFKSEPDCVASQSLETEATVEGAKVITGSFNPIIQSLQRQLHAWDDMVSEFSLEEKIVKMGAIEEQVSPDYRVNGDIVSTPNKSTEWLER